MASIEADVLEEVTREPKSEGFLGVIGGPKFLAAQLFTIVGTIVGVYLAGYVGFERNLEYDRFLKAQQRSDLLTAMHEELEQNVNRLRKFNERLGAADTNWVSGASWPRLRLFVWQAAGRSSTALDMPPQILINMQSLYEDLGDMLGDQAARSQFWETDSSTSNTSFRKKFRERLNDQLKFAETSILPAMDQAAAASAQLLKRYGDGKKP